MLKKNFLNYIRKVDNLFLDEVKQDYLYPQYNPESHYLDLSTFKYYKALVALRSSVKHACDYYWSQIEDAYNVDLFMITPSVSSPMGPGSDSEAIQIEFGNLKTFLVDSSQFGFEPIILSGIEKVYCYLPSMRGEEPDNRHLNQFYHCEAEINGDIKKLIPSVESFIKFLAETCLNMPNLLNLLSLNDNLSKEYLENILNVEKFFSIKFDEAVKILETNGFSELINYSSFGKILTSSAELELLKILNTKLPIWIEEFDRDTVAFYQKPIEGNKVINCDLLFPQMTEGSFWGEIVGAGQRQDNYSEMVESLKRQGLDPAPYEWYMNIRKNKNYMTTSGFGLGVERFLAWVLCRGDVKDVIPYPRLKNIITYP